MEVDKVCDAGDMFDNEHNGGAAPSRVRCVHSRHASCARHSAAVVLTRLLVRFGAQKVSCDRQVCLLCHVMPAVKPMDASRMVE